MAAISKRWTNRQAVGVFYRADRLREALQALASTGVETTALSLLAQEEAIDVRLRRTAGAVEGEHMASLLESLVDLDGACGTRVCAAGPLLGPLRRAEAVRTDGAHPHFAKWLPARLAGMLQDQLDNGGLLLCGSSCGTAWRSSGSARSSFGIVKAVFRSTTCRCRRKTTSLWREDGARRFNGFPIGRK